MPDSPTKWLLLIHQIPAKPDYLRVKVGRLLRRLGAVALKSTVYLVPASPDSRSTLKGLMREILRRGGEAVVCEARFLAGLSDRAAEDLFRAARESEYAALAEEARRLATGLSEACVDEADRRRAARRLERLRTRLSEIAARDPFGARGRDAAARRLALAEDKIQGIEAVGTASLDPSSPPRSATWVTRAGVMVDRIASAWLIRRFIDPSARFKFVGGRGYRPAKDEIRFDMAGAEFTHRDGLCTFEVLLDRFALGDPALKPIAEIVHDLDLEDERYGRPEAAGVERMILGLALTHKSDAVRLEQGGALFHNLHESFRRRSH